MCFPALVRTDELALWIVLTGADALLGARLGDRCEKYPRNGVVHCGSRTFSEEFGELRPHPKEQIITGAQSPTVLIWDDASPERSTQLPDGVAVADLVSPAHYR